MDDQTIRILLIEDNPGDARLIREMLADTEATGASYPAFELTHADCLSGALERLAGGGVDVALLDLGLPDSQGAGTLARLRTQAPGLPIVVLSGLGDKAMAIQAVQAGAQDYLVKGQVDASLLVRTVRYAVERQQLVTELQRKAQEVQASETRLRNIIEEYADGVIIVDREGTVRFANPAAAKLFARGSDALVGQSFGFPIIAQERTELDIIGSGAEPGTAEMRVTETQWEGEVAYLASLRDITERARAEEQIKAALQEKEVLLKEIHHRVKNNLQVVVSLLKLQAEDIEDPQTRDAFRESQNRVKSMALVHEQLYRSKDMARIDIGEYVSSLAKDVFRSCNARAAGITLKVDTCDALLDVDRATPCGLIVNELISNALKHAFPHGRGGQVGIELSSDDEVFALVVGDNGIGLPKDLDLSRVESLGLKLVRTLVRQIGGTIAINGEGGTKVEITFPALKHRKGG